MTYNIASNDDQILPPDIRCPLCSPEDEVGAVIRACLDLVVACEGCHRQRGYEWMRDRRAKLQAALRRGDHRDTLERRVIDRSLILFEGEDTVVLPNPDSNDMEALEATRETIARLMKERNE
jgi:hypothetical protein